MNDQNNPQSTTEIPSETRAFLESLLEDTHMQFTSDTEKEELIQQLYSKLDYYLTARIVEALPEEALDQFTKMNDEGKPREEMEAFMLEKIPNAQELFQKAFVEFRDLYVGATNDSMAQQTSGAPEASPVPTENVPANAPVGQEASEDVPPPPPPAPLPPRSDDENGSNPMSN